MHGVTVGEQGLQRMACLTCPCPPSQRVGPLWLRHRRPHEGRPLHLPQRPPPTRVRGDCGGRTSCLRLHGCPVLAAAYDRAGFCPPSLHFPCRFEVHPRQLLGPIAWEIGSLALRCLPYWLCRHNAYAQAYMGIVAVPICCQWESTSKGSSTTRKPSPALWP